MSRQFIKRTAVHRASVLCMIGLALLMARSSVASAHTVEICWSDINGVTTFYAGTYHSAAEGPSPVGDIIVDGFNYPFSGYVLASQLPSNVTCYTCPGGVPQVNHYQTFTAAFPLQSHSITFDSSTVVQAPWCPIPDQTFGGGGSCADADFDGICNDDDACPLDAANDGDGDGICADADNCPLDYNPTQTDANNNGQGDICEGVVCGNGLLQGTEECDDGNIAGGDGCSAICTLEVTDSDGDGIDDPADNCPGNANADQADGDNDDVGDVCDDWHDLCGDANGVVVPLFSPTDHTIPDNDNGLSNWIYLTSSYPYLYGSSAYAFRVFANGFSSHLWFDGAGDTSVNAPLPYTGDNLSGVIAPMWADLENVTVCMLEGSDGVTLQWTGNEASTGGLVEFQSDIVASTGVITFSYGPNHDPATSNTASIGLEGQPWHGGLSLGFQVAGATDPLTGFVLTPDHPNWSSSYAVAGF